MSATSDVITPSASSAASGSNPAGKFLIAGIGLMIAAVVLLFITGSAADPARPFVGYLLGISYWISILIGMLFITQLWYLFDAGWPIILRRQTENAFAAFPILGLLFLPLIAMVFIPGMQDKVAWLWMDQAAAVPGGHGTVGEDVLFIHKSGYLDALFFTLRVVFIFGVFWAVSGLLRSWSYQMDETGDHKFVHYARRLSAAGIPLCAIATTLAAVDWFKTLNYHWFSTMYGVWFFAASFRTALAALVLIMFWQNSRDNGPIKGLFKPAHSYFMGCLMLAFTIFWAYISFSQFFLIYNANIPEETFWYNMRELAADGSGKNSWWWVSRALIYGYFFVPFLWLIFYTNKFKWRIQLAAVWFLVFHVLDLYWNILPQKLPSADPAHVLGYVTRSFNLLQPAALVDVTAFLGAGALTIWAFLRAGATHKAIPIRDPRINESIHAHE